MKKGARGVKTGIDLYSFGSPMPGRTYVSSGYRYGFNGQEKDDEIAGAGNIMSAEYWEYDTRLGRRWNRDPVTKPWMSPYHAFSNRPIWNVDPNGATDGDYYSKSGEHLGSDGKDDNKVYVADAVTKNDKGIVTSAQNSSDLGVTHSEFAISSNVVKHESSGDKTESLWIAHTANNAKDNDAIDYKKQNSTLNDQLTDPKYSTTPSEARTELSVTDNSQSANNARAAVINVHNNGADPTGGAVLWDGVDFLAKGERHNKFKEYNNVTVGATDVWNYYQNVGTNNKKYKVDINTFFKPIVFSIDLNQTGNKKANYNIQSTGTQGSSLFWKIQKK